MIDKLLQSKCRNLLKEYSDVIEHAEKEAVKRIDSERISGNTAFEYAKKSIRNEALKEGILLLRREISKYAEYK